MGREGKNIPNTFNEESAIIAKAIRGDQEAFRWIINAYQDFVYRLAFGIVKNESDAEDIIQEVFLNVHRFLPQFRQEQSFKNWIAKIAVHRSIDFKRKAYVKREEATHLLEDIVVDSHVSSGVEHAIMHREKIAHIQRQMDQLPPNYREVIHAFYIEEKSYDEIAKEQGVKRKTVESKLYRARNWMRKHWKEDEP